jgi:hypothetical protein
MYTKAIEEDPSEAVYYSNSISLLNYTIGAAVYLVLEDFD